MNTKCPRCILVDRLAKILRQRLRDLRPKRKCPYCEKEIAHHLGLTCGEIECVRDYRRQKKHEARLKPGPKRLQISPDSSNPISMRNLGDRAGWKCHACGGAVPRSGEVPWNDPLAPTVSHFVPLSVPYDDHPGSEPWALGLAHRRCNASMGTTAEVQLHLPGSV